MKHSLLYPVPLALAALLAGCAQDAATPISPSDAALARSGPSTTVPLKVVWSSGPYSSSTTDGIHNDVGVLGAGNDDGTANSGGSDTYTRYKCGVGAHTWTGDNQNGWFDTQPTNYKDTNPDCLRWLTLTGQGIKDKTTGELMPRIENLKTDAEVRVFGLTSATTTGSYHRVGMGIQTAGVPDALGCQILVYDTAAYSGPGGESAFVQLLDATPGARKWSVKGAWAECEVIDPKSGKRSTKGAVYFPFSFTMQEI